MRTAFYTTLSLLVLLLLNCSIGVDVAGGSEIGNPITVAGKVMYPNNSPAHNALVRLRPESYLADTSGIIDTTKPSQIQDLRTDNAGNFPAIINPLRLSVVVSSLLILRCGKDAFSCALSGNV